MRTGSQHAQRRRGSKASPGTQRGARGFGAPSTRTLPCRPSTSWTDLALFIGARGARLGPCTGPSRSAPLRAPPAPADKGSWNKKQKSPTDEKMKSRISHDARPAVVNREVGAGWACGRRERRARDATSVMRGRAPRAPRVRASRAAAHRALLACVPRVPPLCMVPTPVAGVELLLTHLPSSEQAGCLIARP